MAKSWSTQKCAKTFPISCILRSKYKMTTVEGFSGHSGLFCTGFHLFGRERHRKVLATKKSVAACSEQGSFAGLSKLLQKCPPNVHTGRYLGFPCNIWGNISRKLVDPNTWLLGSLTAFKCRRPFPEKLVQIFSPISYMWHFLAPSVKTWSQKNNFCKHYEKIFTKIKWISYNIMFFYTLAVSIYQILIVFNY